MRGPCTFSTGAKLLCWTAAVLHLAAAAAVEITVLDPEGRPARQVVVACARGAVGIVLTDDAGRSTLPESCVEAECRRGRFLPGRVSIAGGTSVCRLGRGLVVRGEVRGTNPDEPYVVALRSRESRGAASSAHLEPTDRSDPRRFALEAVPAGPYVLEIARTRDLWSCFADFGPFPEGEREVLAAWREPLEVRGVALDPAERPFARVLLHVEYEQGDAHGSTRCEMDPSALDVVSGQDGRFRALVDAARPYRIVADPAWRPAAIRIDRGSRVENP